MQKASPEYTLIILSISSPLLLGVYRDKELIDTIKSDKKISEVLLTMVLSVMERYPLSKMIYTRGPGSYMAIKLTYIILETIYIVKKIPFQGCSAFAFNGDKPIKAMGNIYFIKEGGQIKTQKFDHPVPQKYTLPDLLKDLSLDESPIPDYVLPAVLPNNTKKGDLCL